MQSLTQNCRSIIFLLLALLSFAACNLPISTPPPITPSPLSEPTLTVTPAPSPTVQLVTWHGAPTRTPFQPQSPTHTSTAAPSEPPPATATTAAAPTVTPNLATWAPPDANGPTPSTPVPDPYPNYSGPDTINFLLVGSDRRTSSFRTDTLIIASLQPQERLVTLISVPRDLYVYIPGWTMNRVNTAYMRGEMSGHPGGGPGLLKDTILYNLGVRIDHLAMVEFDGFEEIVDTLGGIDVPLACPFTDWHIKNPRRSDQDPNNWELYTIGPGMVHMDGDLALWYARSRLRSSDFDRGRRQQEVLRAIYTRGMQLNVIPHLPKLYKQMREAVTTDLSLDDLLELAPVATDLGGEHRIRSFYINKDVLTAWRTPSGAAVQLPKRAALEELIASAMSPPEKEERRELKLVVEVRNATDNADWDLLAAQRLHYAGYETRVVPFDQDDHDRTWLYDFTTEQDPEQSTAVRRALGLPASSVISDPEADSPVHYRLVLGEDYNPCFNPASPVISEK
ncbi:MAG TPA: LCP family protein [Anaerolineales bacterium]